MIFTQQLPTLYFTQKGARCTVFFRNPSFQVRVQLLLVEALSHFATNSSIMKLYLLISSFLGRTSLLYNEVYLTPSAIFKRKKLKQLRGKCFYFLVMMVMWFIVVSCIYFGYQTINGDTSSLALFSSIEKGIK